MESQINQTKCKIFVPHNTKWSDIKIYKLQLCPHVHRVGNGKAKVDPVFIKKSGDKYTVIEGKTDIDNQVKTNTSYQVGKHVVHKSYKKKFVYKITRLPSDASQIEITKWNGKKFHGPAQKVAKSDYVIVKYQKYKKQLNKD